MSARKVNLRFFLSLKSWAMVMALINLALGIGIIIGGGIWISQNHVLDTFKTYFAVGVGLGILNMASGCLLLTAVIQGNDNWVLLYILLEFVIAFTLTIFSAMNVYNEFSIVLFSLLCLCPILWIGLCNIYAFYVELYQYNNSSVQAGIDEIACNMQTNPLESFPEKALDTTTV
ncbi:uncharacterized protein LOC115885261 [Sitophilus oryzae]|uniref:Uncharacterized protein LOC115885261 n=1 Tax=Sitophilus oryzae TaxID=7048 RepID=A0A6J2Y9U3_SITOR|nr:uncharacterized protein LOC115885261 [Sitophilus oryzae]